MGTEAREELKAKQLEKVIYFAANLVTWVDHEQAATMSCPTSRPRSIGEREAIDKERELEIAERATRSFEGEVKPSSRQKTPRTADIKARQKQAWEKDIADHPRAATRVELDLVLQRSFDELKDLHSRKIIEDEMLWRELVRTATPSTSRAAWAPTRSPA